VAGRRARVRAIADARDTPASIIGLAESIGALHARAISANRFARRGAAREGGGKKKKREREKKRKRRGEEREITKASTSGCNDAMARVTREEPLNGASALPRIIAAFGSRGKISATPGDRNLAATAAL